MLLHRQPCRGRAQEGIESYYRPTLWWLDLLPHENDMDLSGQFQLLQTLSYLYTYSTKCCDRFTKHAKVRWHEVRMPELCPFWRSSPLSTRATAALTANRMTIAIKCSHSPVQNILPSASTVTKKKKKVSPCSYDKWSMHSWVLIICY